MALPALDGEMGLVVTCRAHLTGPLPPLGRVAEARNILWLAESLCKAMQAICALHASIIGGLLHGIKR